MFFFSKKVNVLINTNKKILLFYIFGKIPKRGLNFVIALGP